MEGRTSEAQVAPDGNAEPNGRVENLTPDGGTVVVVVGGVVVVVVVGGVVVGAGSVRSTLPTRYPTASTTRLTPLDPEITVRRHTSPPCDMVSVAWFERITPGHRLIVDTTGSDRSHGQAVTYPKPLPPTATMLIVAPAALLGTPAYPATRIRTSCPLPTAPTVPPCPDRVSRRRAGVTARIALLDDIDPNTSMIRSVSVDEVTHTFPPPSPLNVKCGTISLGSKLMFDALELEPHGLTSTYPRVRLHDRHVQRRRRRVRRNPCLPGDPILVLTPGGEPLAGSRVQQSRRRDRLQVTPGGGPGEIGDEVDLGRGREAHTSRGVSKRNHVRSRTTGHEVQDRGCRRRISTRPRRHISGCGGTGVGEIEKDRGFAVLRNGAERQLQNATWLQGLGRRTEPDTSVEHPCRRLIDDSGVSAGRDSQGRHHQCDGGRGCDESA